METMSSVIADHIVLGILLDCKLSSSAIKVVYTVKMNSKPLAAVGIHALLQENLCALAAAVPF